ncbi:MAG: MFS transporter [Promethearchaeota archaeon]
MEDSIYDPEGLWKIASTKKMMSYSFGFILTLYMMTAFNSLVFYFYEVEVGLRVELVSLAIIFYSIITIIVSPILGYLTDRSFKFSKKLGFRTPWIIISAIPALFFYFFIFMPPDINAKSNPYPIFWFLLIMSSLFGIFISLFMAHFEGSFTSQFREDYERIR